MSTASHLACAPICLFVYNRLWHTQQTIAALAGNDLAADSDLVIYSDGPKSPEDAKAVAVLRNYLKTLSGFHSVTVIERESNLGLANSIIQGVTEVLARYPSVIVVEDDLVTSSRFLAFMNDALRYYGAYGNVASIHGYVYPFAKPMPEDFFIYGADCWGWATWREQWAVFEPDGRKLLEQLEHSGRIAEFDFGVAAGYSAMLRDQIAGRNNSWAIRWKASCFLLNKLTLYPRQSFVQNIGNDDSGTHCAQTEAYIHSALCEDYAGLKPVPVVLSRVGYRRMGEFYRSHRPGIGQRWSRPLMRLLRQLLSGRRR